MRNSRLYLKNEKRKCIIKTFMYIYKHKIRIKFWHCLDQISHKSIIYARGIRTLKVLKSNWIIRYAEILRSNKFIERYWYIYKFGPCTILSFTFTNLEARQNNEHFLFVHWDLKIHFVTGDFHSITKEAKIGVLTYINSHNWQFKSSKSKYNM